MFGCDAFGASFIGPASQRCRRTLVPVTVTSPSQRPFSCILCPPLFRHPSFAISPYHVLLTHLPLTYLVLSLEFHLVMRRALFSSVNYYVQVDVARCTSVDIPLVVSVPSQRSSLPDKVLRS